MANLILNGSTSGSVTLSSPAVSGTTTLTLPTTSGTVITTASTFAGTGPAFSVYISADQSISLATWTKVQFNGEYFDTNNTFDSTTNYRFTPNVAGYYQINFVTTGISGAGRAFLGAIYKNGARIITTGVYMASASSIDDGPATIANVFYMNGSTDYIEFYVYQDGGTGLVFTGYTIASGFLARSA
jgi:hypothetical protein